ncbi:carbohydrate ABC transporter membrane protein 1 (CUT1 family) [Tamaricihabitans halophyticus]|uniref:Carbohydrate ABC transporter membrane protein 1 (CUT1 family) n=1 Tax=Tamaricihabitans halophyticus TaxID=1262583 RepID=A0A4R2Q8E6_9PSEU|nr:sugar ABC transporter permease [Tamaricihabitans halophyticus]TCP45090.1 carbohydrate ABC transporter membrane protein 1 (CUT1 family) [Tamaricihabitans halophyticus]
MAATTVQRPRSRSPLRKHSVPYLHLAPALLAVVLTTVYPLVSALITSFRHWRLNETREAGEFVGLAQYQRVFTDDTFFNSALVTLNFTVISVVLSVGLGLCIALILNNRTRLSALTKALLILPFAVAPALKGFSWRFMLNPDTGVYDKMLDSVLPFADNINWLGDPFWALMVLALTEVWGWAPLIALMLLGGLNSISPEVREAARIDGANAWQQFWRVTFPLLRPLLLIVVFLKAVFSVKIFDQVVTTTGGGPGRATESLNFFAYSQGFTFLDIGYASAVSWVIVLVLGVLAALYLIAMARQEAK